MQTAVIASGYLSVRLSDTFRCFVQSNEDTIVGFSLFSDRYDYPSFWRGSLFTYSQGIAHSKGIKVRHSHVTSENLTSNQP